MRIKELNIRNFRSHKDTYIWNLENLLILIGENGSGKTNIFEALDLCFNHFEFPHEQPRGVLTNENWFLWFDGNTDEAIEFKVTLGGLSTAQFKKLAEAGNVKQQKGDLVINRSIVSVNDSLIYRNNSIEWGSVVIRRSDAGYSVEGGIEFDPNSFVQVMNDSILKNAFSYIPITRGPELNIAHGSILKHEVRQELLKLGQDVSPKGMQKWNRIRQMYSDRGWTLEPLECKGGQLVTQRGTTCIPYELEGVGYQGLFNLLRQIEMAGPIVAIEEPENHLHPNLQKTFIKAVKEIFGSTKQVLLATHSPFIFDLVNLKSIWFVYKDGLESKLQNVISLEDINSVLKELGVKPSDLLLANGILVVEGPTDKDVYADWARKNGTPFESASILIIDAEGAGNIKKYLLSEAVQKTCIKTYALCDANSESTIRNAVKGIVPEENIISLKKGDIEDYYPRELVIEFVKEFAAKRGKTDVEIPSEIPEGETVRKLDEILGKDTGWKKKLAEKVIKEMKPEQIGGEVKSKLTKVYDSIY